MKPNIKIIIRDKKGNIIIHYANATRIVCVKTGDLHIYFENGGALISKNDYSWFEIEQN